MEISESTGLFKHSKAKQLQRKMCRWKKSSRSSVFLYEGNIVGEPSLGKKNACVGILWKPDK